MTKERLLTIDSARFIGISLIILAHVLGPGSLLFQIRSFDVPLMVFISGLTSSGKDIPNYWKYFSHRFLRLMVPVWIFYSLYFVILYIGFRLNWAIDFPSWGIIGRTFLCLEGYGWIIRVFVLIALVAPFLIKLEDKVRNPFVFLVITGGLIVIQEPLSHVFKGTDSALYKDLWEGCLLSLTGYIPAFLAGLRMRNAQRWEQLLFVAIFSLTTILVFISPAIPFDLEYFKRPPRFPFIVYGIAVSCLIWLCQPVLKELSKIRPCVFVGQNTIWIYMWHILILLFVFRIQVPWWAQYLIVLGGAITLFLPQFYLCKQHRLGGLSKYLVG